MISSQSGLTWWSVGPKLHVWVELLIKAYSPYCACSPILWTNMHIYGGTLFIMHSLFFSNEAHRLNCGWNWGILPSWTFDLLRCRTSPSTAAYSRPCCSSGASFFPTRMWRKADTNRWSIVGNEMCRVSLCISFMWGNCGSVSSNVSRPPCCRDILLRGD